MNYRNLANAMTPALVIYLLDCSGSMEKECGSATRIQVVQEALQKVIVKMIQRSTKGATVSPRYRIAMFAYSDTPVDLLGGIKTISELAQMGLPQLAVIGELTKASHAFAEAEELLKIEVPNLSPKDPAPQVCHFTDGEFSPGGDPSQSAQRIRSLVTPDGNVLVENVYITSELLNIPDVKKWPGIRSEQELPDHYSKTLFYMSSPIPDSYRAVMGDWGYGLESGSRMLFPGNQRELVELGFAISGATPVTKAQ